MKAHISMRHAASIAALMTIKDVTEDDAKEIRHIWRTVTNRREARDAINNVLRTHGVEYLGVHRRTADHVYYCNTGETYATTVIFSGLRMRVACWGDMVEKNLIKEPESY